MRKRQKSITNSLYAVLAIAALLIIWQAVSSLGLVPKYMLPSPADVLKAFINDFDLLMQNLAVTLTEAILGLAFGIFIGFSLAALMDRFLLLYNTLYPLLVITQTVPAIAIAPLLVLWFGYGIAPKILLIVIVTFFPIAVGLLDGFRSADRDTICLMQSMGAKKSQIFIYVKLPGALSHFFAGLKISASYSVVGGVISEWLGGFEGLGVYMIRVKKSYSFDKMFAVIFLISAISLLLMKGVDLLHKKSMPWEYGIKK